MGPIDEVFEVYVEGVSVGRFGRWEPKPESPFNRNLAFPIPPGLVKGSTVHIALRRWVGATSTGLFPFYSSGAERFTHPLEIGLLSTISARTALYQYRGVVSEPALEPLPALDAGCRLHCIRFVQCAAQSYRIHFARHLLRRLSARSLRGRIPGCERFRDAPLLGANPGVCRILAGHSEFLPLSFADLPALSALDSGGRSLECDSRGLCGLRLCVSGPPCEFLALHFRLQSARHHYSAGGVGAASGTESRIRCHRNLPSCWFN